MSVDLAGKSLSGSYKRSCSLFLLFGSEGWIWSEEEVFSLYKICSRFWFSVSSSQTAVSFIVILCFLVIDKKNLNWLAAAEKAHKVPKPPKIRTVLAYSKMLSPLKMLNWEIAEAILFPIAGLDLCESALWETSLGNSWQAVPQHHLLTKLGASSSSAAV